MLLQTCTVPLAVMTAAFSVQARAVHAAQICVCVCDAELKAVHDSFVEVYMKQPEDYCFAFFHDVIVPVCETMASCGRRKGQLAGMVAFPDNLPQLKVCT